ncbi:MULTISPECIES: ATP phosphoribosyltransferase [Geomonas]|uniref:ATP phosphoribosyltransferase n=1 Tax=Geomonas TaxID=2651583 RepID=UPI00100B362D|nr:MULTISPECIES: ATP phosphoribosyltransferase [Geomonas]
MENQLKLGVPKGSLENATVELFKKAGWQISISSRSYFPGIDDKEIKCSLIRPQEMGKYVERGTIDVGIAGRDWIRENDSDVVEVCEMVYSKVSRRPARWVLVVNGDSKIKGPEDLHGATISTELVGFTKRYFAERNIPVNVEFSWGATEAKVVEGLCDAIVEVTETGSTIKANGLRIVTELMESVPVMVANKASWEDPWKREKIQQIATLLQSALRAEGMVGLKMNAPKDKVAAITAVIPSLKSPTVANHYNSDWVSIESIMPEQEVRRIVPELIKLGAEGIVEYSLNKII